MAMKTAMCFAPLPVLQNCKSTTKQFLRLCATALPWMVPVMEYRGVDVMTGAELFRQGPFQDATNNIGEFLALVHALAFFHNTQNDHTAIYSDSRTALAWVRDRKCKSKLERTTNNERVFELIGRAERWLATHSWTNRIIKWDTEEWGEIPADFGRK